MGMLSWATDLFCMFYNGIGGMTGVYLICDRCFDLLTWIGNIVGTVSK